MKKKQKMKEYQKEYQKEYRKNMSDEQKQRYKKIEVNVIKINIIK